MEGKVEVEAIQEMKGWLFSLLLHDLSAVGDCNHELLQSMQEAVDMVVGFSNNFGDMHTHLDGLYYAFIKSCS